MNELPNALSTFSYCRRQRTIEFAVKKELSVFGIEAHDIGRQHIDGIIRCELRNVFAVTLRMAVSVIAFHEVSTRTFAATPDRQCKEFSLVARAPSPSSRASVSGSSVSQ